MTSVAPDCLGFPKRRNHFGAFTRDRRPDASDYLGPFAKSIEGYPFGEMTEVYGYRAEVGHKVAGDYVRESRNTGEST